MNYKVDQNAKTLQKNRQNPQRQQWPGQRYWIILVTTIILLVSFTAALFVLLLTENAGSKSPSSSNAENWAEKNAGGNKEQSTQQAVGNSTVYATTPSLSDYIAQSSSVTQKIDGFIESNNTILVEIGSSTCVSKAEKNPDDRIYPASMTKVMSLLVACENLTDTTTKLTVSEKNVQYMAANEGSGYGLKPGEILTVKDLLYLTSYQSDTVAILTLAEHISGSEEKFVELMNAKARAIGLNNTHFSNCTGLHSENNYTTCREMAAIMIYALDNPLCKELLTSYAGYSLVTNMRTEADKCKFYSTWYSSKERFADNPRLETVIVKGGKTGYTDESGVCLVTYAESKNTGKKYVNVIVGKPKGSGLSETKSTSEVKMIYNKYAE